MGRKPGFRHSEATKRKIAMTTKAALSGGVAFPSPESSKPTVSDTLARSHVEVRDPLDALAMGPAKDVIALMLWKARHSEPELAVQITENDLSGFNACVNYLGVVPDVRIVRPQGRPGHGEIPATKTRSAIPAQEASPPRTFVVVSLVERGTENAIRPVENNTEDWQAAEEAKAFKHARDNALRIAGQMQQDAATGNFSSSTINDAVQCLVALAR